MVRRDEDRPVEVAERLHPRRADAVEHGGERVHDEELGGDADGADERAERPAPAHRLALLTPGGLDHRPHLGDGRVGGEGVVVEVDAELLLDHAEELDPLERVHLQVRLETRRRHEPVRGNAGHLGDDGGDGVGGQRVELRPDPRRADARRGRAGRGGLDQLRQPLQDLRLLHLHRVGARQVLLRPDREGADPLVGREAPVRSPDDVLGDGRVVEEEDGVDAEVRAGRPADDGRVGEALVLAEDRLDVLRVHLLAVGQGEHVLLAAAEDEEPVGRELAEVAGVVPALGVDRGRGGLRVPPVTGEAAGAAGKDLAVLGEADLDAGDRLADRLHPVPVRPGERDDRPHLRRPVALEDVDPHLRPALPELDVHRRGPEADRVKLPADRREDRREQDPPGGLRERPGEGVEALERLPPAGLVDPPLDGGVDEPQALRHDEQDRGLEVAEGPQEDDRLPAHGVDDAGPDRQRRDEPEDLLVEVRERQDRDHPVVLAERHDRGHAGGHGEQVAMAEHRPLRIAGRPAREDDLGKVVGLDRRRRQRLGASGAIRQRLDEDDREAELARRLLGLPAGDDEAGLGLRRDLAPELDRVADVDGDRDAARMDEPEEGEPPLGPVHRPDDRTVAGSEALVGEDAGDPRHGMPEVAIADRPGPERGPDHQRRPAVEPGADLLDEIDQRLHGSSSGVGGAHCAPVARKGLDGLVRPFREGRVVAEDDRRHVELGQPPDARAGRGVVVAVDPARGDDAAASALEDVAGEQEAVARGVEADAPRRVAGRVDDPQAAEEREDVAVLHRPNDRRRAGDRREQPAPGR